MTIRGVEIEGIGPFREHRRFALGPGAVVLRGGNETGKSTLLDLLALLLDPEPGLEIAPFLRTNPPPERSRAALDLADAEGPFRVCADFDARVLTLQEGEEGAILEGPPDAVVQGIRSRLALPGHGFYERLFTASSEKVTPAARGGRLGDAQRALEARAAARAARTARGRVETLRSQLAVVREREVQQGLRDSEAERGRELEADLARVRAARDELEAVETELRGTSALAGAPADLGERVVDYERLAGELAEAEAAVEAAGRELDLREAELRGPSVARRTALLVSGVLLAGAAALFVLGSLLAPLAGVLGAVCLVVAGVLALRTRLALARAAEERSQHGDRLRVLRHRFELETVAVRSLATALGLDSPADLPSAIAHHEERVERRDRIRAACEAESDPVEIEAELRAVRARIEAVGEPEEPAPAADPVDSAALRVELETAERELRLAERAAHDAAARAEAEEVSPAAWMVEGLLRAAAAFQAREPAETWDDAESLAGAYIRALSGRGYAAIRRKGEARYLLEREGREPLPLEDATGTAAEILHHAVQFALAERAALIHPLPLLLDDPFVRLDADRLRGAARCVRRLGAVTQVVLATSEPLFERVADQVVPLA